MEAVEKTREFVKGYKAEGVIADLLRSEGCYVIITADVKMRNGNKAPGATNGSGGFITLPDLDVANQGYRGFVEIKYKSKASFTTITGRLEHGVGYGNFLAYQKASKEFGVPTFLFIYEGDSGAVLFNRIDILLPERDYHIEKNGAMNLIYQAEGESSPVARVYAGGAMNRGGMIFFPRSAFDLWGRVAIMEDNIYTQLGFFDSIDGEGDRTFEIVRNRASAFYESLQN